MSLVGSALSPELVLRKAEHPPGYTSAFRRLHQSTPNSHQSPEQTPASSPLCTHLLLHKPLLLPVSAFSWDSAASTHCATHHQRDGFPVFISQQLHSRRFVDEMSPSTLTCLKHSTQP